MKDDLVLSEIQGSCRWPVPVTLDSPSLSLFGQHHDGSTLLFPYQSPEVITGVRERPLGGYEGLPLVIALRGEHCNVQTHASDTECMYVHVYLCVQCLHGRLLVSTQVNKMVTYINKVSIDVVRSLHARDEAETTSTSVN